MDRVHSVAEKPFENLEHAGVAIGIVDVDQRHIGMLHRDSESDAILMLHLAWHHRLQNEPPDRDFLWINTPIHPRRLVQVAALCRRIWKANNAGGIPYAFSQPSDCFDAATGKYLLGPTSFGLTCATFVLAVFHAAGLQLVDYQFWPKGRDGDERWQAKIVAVLEKTGASDDHVASVRMEIGAIRYRPEEVAGAATESSLPVGYTLAFAHGEQILNRLQEL